jgi:microtubule-associated protein, RP/EB family
MATGENIGMMEGAFFVSRKTVLNWINALLKLNLQKIEQTCTGAIACQLCDALYGPESKRVPMHKLKWNCKTDHEYTHNYKILQDVFQKVGVNKVVPVAQLVRGKYQDNLEFMQWFKRFYELNMGSGPDGYDAIGRRKKGRGVDEFERLLGIGSVKLKTSKPICAPFNSQSKTSSNMHLPLEKCAVEHNGKVKRKKPPIATEKENSAKAVRTNAQTKMSSLQNQVNNLVHENHSLSSTIRDLEKERNFYFGKLRDIEIILQNLSDDDGKKEEYYRGAEDLSVALFKILYAVDDEFLPNATPTKSAETDNRV